MRDLAFLAFLAALLAMGLRRPFLFVLAYAYVDIVSPQHLSWSLLSSIPISMIVAACAVGGWLIADDKRGFGIAPRQWLMIVLLAYAGFTTFHADRPIEALEKWEWVWKAMFWAIFLPLTLRTRLRIEAYLLVMILSASAIIVVGGIKTVMSGGGYGALNLMVESNSGLFESSTISCVAIASIPIILWLARFGTIFPPDWRVRLYAAALVFSCLLIPVGTEARTGLVCIAVMAVLMLRDVRRRFLYVALAGFIAVAAVPFLPQSFTSRMGTISTYQADSSAGTRLAVWAWTWDYVKENPAGGGFDAYLQNRIAFNTVKSRTAGAVETIEARPQVDAGRAYHSAYFEMLGEQGFAGLILWLLIHVIGLVRMEVLRRRHARAAGEDAWIAPLATALQHAQIIYLIGALFIGIAWQPFVLMLLAVQIGFDRWVGRRMKAGPEASPLFIPVPPALPRFPAA